MIVAEAAGLPYIGLMSGTSLDGIDGVLVAFEENASGGLALRVLGHAHAPFDGTLAAELLALNRAGADEIHRGALAATALARQSARIVAALLAASGRQPDGVAAIGSHGQTVRHRPAEFDGTGYTVQLNNPAMLAELSGIDVVADFRSRDIAAGGQGAPLVPAFHRAVFGAGARSLAVLNLGGMANLSLLAASGKTLGFDCGPGNVLLDGWCRRWRGEAFDRGGAWSRTGRVDDTLLAALLSEPFFARQPPKSTGRDNFNLGWLDARLAAAGRGALPPQDVQATLVELTASACAAELLRHGGDCERLLVCGGGALNPHLLDRLQAHLPGKPVATTAEAGLAPQLVEACAFAWLARAWHLRQPGNLAAATGAAGPRILGALYPAH